MTRRDHPDLHELHDWPDYGPKNPDIANAVRRLAFDHDLRVSEIEEIILRALQARLTEEQTSGDETRS